MRGDFLARQWRLIKAIAASSQGITAAQLAEQENVELRTVYRDLQTLQDAGFPLFGKRDGRSTKWSIVDPVRGKGMPAPFTAGELIALRLAQDMLAKLPDKSLSNALGSLFTKFTSNLAQNSLAKLNEIQNSFSMVSMSEQSRKDLEQKIDLISQMVLAKKRMLIAYKEDGGDEVKDLQIDPYRTWRYEDLWYLMAYIHEQGKTRILPVINITKMRLIDEDSMPDPHFDLGVFMRDVSQQVMLDKLRFKVKVAPSWQKWFSPGKEEPPYAGTMNSDGSLEIEMSLGAYVAGARQDEAP
jgi:predicted DNA-binding transcriptional regulator YafY